MKGKIVEIVNSNLVRIEISCHEEKEKEAISHCGACGLFRKDAKAEIILARNSEHRVIGEEVECALEENAQMKSSALLLMLPIIIFLVTSGIVSSLTIKTWYILLISFTALVITFLVLKFVLKDKTYYYICTLKGK